MPTPRLSSLLLLCFCSPLVNAQIEISGVSSEMEDSIRGNLSLTESCEQPRWLVRYRTRTAKTEISRALEAYSYYSPQVDSELTFDDSCFSAIFDIDPGPITNIVAADVGISGGGGLFQSLLQQSPIKVGQNFSHQAYEGFKADVSGIANRYGFVDGDFSKQQVLVDAEKNTATIELHYDAGQRYRFGETRYSTDALNDTLLERYQKYARGDPYDTAELDQLYQSLSASGYFDDVLVLPGKPDEGEIPIDVNLQVGDPVRTRLGLGISTDLGPSFSARRANRLRNPSGHQSSIDMVLSSVNAELGGRYRIPQTNRADGWLSFYGGLSTEDTETSRTSSATSGIRKISPRKSGWVETYFVELNHDAFDVAGESDSTTYITPGVNFSYSRRDGNISRPARAHQVSVEMLGASRGLGSSVDVTSIRLEGRLIRSISENIRLIGRSRIGALETNDFSALPPRLRFFSGGDYRMRGFDFEEIGVTNDNGDVIGGDRLLEFSLEADHKLGNAYGVAIFTDIASVTRDDFSFDFRKAAGIGFRWYSPLGPLRVDMAHPIDDEVSDSWRLHLTLGADI